MQGWTIEIGDIPFNNNCSGPGPPMHAWLASAETAESTRAKAEQSAESHWWPRGSQRWDAESRCLLCSRGEQQAEDRQDDCRIVFWTKTVRACNRLLASLSSLRSLTTLPCQFFDTHTAEWFSTIGPQRAWSWHRDKLSGSLLIRLRHLIYSHMKTISGE